MERTLRTARCAGAVGFIAALDALAPERFGWRMQLVDALDLLAWPWVLYAAPAAARRDVEALRRRFVGSARSLANPGERSAPRLPHGTRR